MLVSELKNEINSYNKEQLGKIIVELYKRIPKSKKEYYNIDDFIRNIDNNDKKVVKKELDFDSLKGEISYFLDCVDNGLYAESNSIISEKERSSWRFKVKRYYKELIKILPDSENGSYATFLLIELFKRLSIGSNTLLFINWQTFGALGVSQGDYYDVIVKRIFYNGYAEDDLKRCINLLEVKKDPYGLSYSMFEVFLNNLKTVFVKENSIELVNDKIKELKEDLRKEENSTNKFYICQLLNYYVELVSDIYFSLSEKEKGIKFFHSNYIEDDKEIKEYILLDKLDELNLVNEWLSEYEFYKDKLDFRDSLKERYKELRRL